MLLANINAVPTSYEKSKPKLNKHLSSNFPSGLRIDHVICMLIKLAP
jgi:hypothetical protein